MSTDTSGPTGLPLLKAQLDEVARGLNASIGVVLKEPISHADTLRQLSESVAAAASGYQKDWQTTLGPMMEEIARILPEAQLSPRVLEQMQVPAVVESVRAASKVIDELAKQIVATVPMPRVDAAKMLGITPARVSQIAKVQSGLASASATIRELNASLPAPTISAIPLRVADFIAGSEALREKDDLVGQLERLVELKDKGDLTEDEFTRAKQRLLDQE